MKQKLIIAGALVLLFAIVGLMVWDFYYESKTEGNPYEYDISNLKIIDEKEFCYKKIGEINPQIEEAYCIAIDENDDIFIAGKNKVLIFDKAGNRKKTFNIFEAAKCIAVGTDGNIFVGMKNHIEVFDPSGSLIMQWQKINQKAYITSIAVEDESVFVADAGNKMVYHFNYSGQLINSIGEKKETEFPGFIIPSPHFDLAIGREGQLWVVNPGKHEFLAFNKNGDLFSGWARTSMQLDGFCGCCNPGNIALLHDGSFVTSEKGIERIKIHYPSGDYKCVVAGPDSFEEGTTHIDLAVNSEDKILVLDSENGMVFMFDEK